MNSPILPVDAGENEVASVTIYKFSDGTYSAFRPLGEFGRGLSRGDLDGALAFAREEIDRE